MRTIVGLVLVLSVAVGCGDDSPAGGGGSGGEAIGGATSQGGGGQPSAGGGSDAQGGQPEGGAGGSGGGGFVTVDASCFDEPPAAGPAPAPLKAYTGGTCPTLAEGYNTINSSGADRSFRLAVPADLMDGERLPVIFLWHWLGGEADDFYEQADVQAAVDQQRFLAVIPVAKGDSNLQWPFSTLDDDERVEEELVFFDDMLSCVAGQYDVITECVSSVGVSAGALFTGQLAGLRADYLASFVSLSGGVGGYIREWAHPEHALPGLVLWGGESDTCVVVDFQETSLALEQGLIEDGNFFLECIHTCGHSEPPFEAPKGASQFSGMWQFVFDHPYWLGPGESPYAGGDFPDGMPEWCGVGPGGATLPEGLECGESGC